MAPEGTIVSHLDQAAVQQLLSETYAMLHAYARAISADAHLAEDAVGEASLVILNKAIQSTDHERFAAWARGVVRNKVLKLYRSRRRHEQAIDPSLLDVLDQDFEGRWREDPLLDERQRALRLCMAKLNPGVQQALHLRYVERLDCERVATRLERSLAAIYQLLSRTHRSLSECIRQQLGVKHG